MKYYKLLTQEMTSHKNTKWKLNVPITIEKEGVEMCTDSVLHCYNHPLLAVILNPIHANIKNPLLFEISVDKIVNTDGLKFASKSQTLLKKIDLPEISTEQKVEFGIRVVKLVCKDESWNAWADKWLDNTDRSKESAYTAALAATSAARAANAARAVARAAAYAANVANAANYAADAAADKNEFNKQMISIIESIVKVEK